MKKILSLVTVLALVLALSASAFAADSKTVFKVGICNYVDDASLNQIVENIQNRLTAIGKEQSVTFDISYDNCNADANVMAQIIQNFIADDADITAFPSCSLPFPTRSPPGLSSPSKPPAPTSPAPPTALIPLQS